MTKVKKNEFPMQEYFSLFAEDFLIYANFSLKNDPQNFYKIFEVMPCGDKKEDVVIIDYIIKILDTKGQVEIDKIKPLEDSEQIDAFNTAIKAINDTDNRCQKQYNCLSDRYEQFDNKYFSKKNLKCYECDQLYFVHCLTEIIKGKEYSQIKGFHENIWPARYAIKIADIIQYELDNNPDAKYKERIKIITCCEFESHNNLYEKFNECIINYFFFSLSQFLAKDERNRGRLKICDYCGNFFISKGFYFQRYCNECSAKNKMTPEERRKYMQQYRADSRKEAKLEAQDRRENKIIQYMKDLEISRKEAEQIWEDDQKM